ncbi:MAG: glycolate oxidase iron-sulfur subunit [Cellvibrionaceae bacterium]|jgi:glycolate oxidase iron-sulfur subunit
MQTSIHPDLSGLPHVSEAEDIIRACVHCGFCTATCPTYQHFGDERDGPRGRIYLIKQLLETNTVTEKTQEHLDRCLTCRSCETTCPSGVKYGRLVDVGRGMVDEKVKRKLADQFTRWALRKVLPYPKRFGFLLFWGQLFRPLLIGKLKAKVPPKKIASPWPSTSNTKPHARKMVALAGCAQSIATPNTNAATARVLDKLGVTLIEAPKAGCCGAVDYHLAAHENGLQAMRNNIDAWWPAIEAGAEAIVMTASGCGVMVKEYGKLLGHDPAYAEKAKKVTELTKDISEILAEEDLSVLNVDKEKSTAYHCPCTLQHGQQLRGGVEAILEKAGVPLTKTKDKHLCCGSAGTYSILQAKTSQQLLENKLDALMIDNPEQIVTANVGCQMHLETKAKVPVKHWVELLDQ